MLIYRFAKVAGISKFLSYTILFKHIFLLSTDGLKKQTQ